MMQVHYTYCLIIHITSEKSIIHIAMADNRIANSILYQLYVAGKHYTPNFYDSKPLVHFNWEPLPEGSFEMALKLLTEGVVSSEDAIWERASASEFIHVFVEGPRSRDTWVSPQSCLHISASNSEENEKVYKESPKTENITFK